ncbi:MAG: hypothetical protein ACRDQZ_06980, partial [Mycobacteriales bacterium]
MADVGATRPGFVVLRVDLARLVSETRNAFRGPPVRQRDVANALDLLPHRVTDVEGAWTGDSLVNVGLSHVIADHLARLAGEPSRGLTDDDRTAIRRGCEDIRTQALRVRERLIEDFRDDMAAVLSVVEPELVEAKLRLAFTLQELRAIHGKSQEDIAGATRNLSKEALREYEHTIGYGIADLLRIREIAERFGSPDPAYDYIYRDLGASSDLLYDDRRRLHSRAAQRQAWAERQASRASGVSVSRLATPPRPASSGSLVEAA